MIPIKEYIQKSYLIGGRVYYTPHYSYINNVYYPNWPTTQLTRYTGIIIHTIILGKFNYENKMQKIQNN